MNVCDGSIVYNAAALKYFIVYGMIELIIAKIMYLNLA